MEFIILELILWAGLIFLFWSLRDSLNRMEAEFQEIAIADDRQACPTVPCSRADKLADPIGTYLDQTIYRYAEIEGKSYRFEYVYPEPERPALQQGQRYISPGLVYAECAAPESDAATGQA